MSLLKLSTYAINKKNKANGLNIPNFANSANPLALIVDPQKDVEAFVKCFRFESDNILFHERANINLHTALTGSYCAKVKSPENRSFSNMIDFVVEHKDHISVLFDEDENSLAKQNYESFDIAYGKDNQPQKREVLINEYIRFLEKLSKQYERAK